MFDINDAGGITWGGSYGPNTTISNTIDDGDSVTLKINGEVVSVINIIRIEGENYSGTIHSFPPGYDITFSGLTLGQQVEFTRKNIFTVGKI